MTRKIKFPVLAALCCSVLFATTAQAQFGPEPGASVERIPLDQPFDICDASGNVIDTVQITGSVKFTTDFFFNPANFFPIKLHFHTLAKGEGTSALTGIHYRLNDSTNDGGMLDFSGGTTVINTVRRVKLISRGPSPNALYTFEAKMLVIPDGTTIVNSVEVSSECLPPFL
jgi:hypothetical protein